jgi:hypothetical protein
MMSFDLSSVRLRFAMSEPRGALSLAEDSAAQEQPGAEDKPEVVPEPAVVNFIEAHTLAEDGDDEGDRSDKTVPQAFPESSDLPLAVRSLLKVIRARSAAGEDKNDEKQNSCHS